MAGEENGQSTIKIPTAWLGPIAKWVVLTLLGANLWQTTTSKTELAREQAAWDTETAAKVFKKLASLEDLLAARESETR